ncbi:hypothetical protein GV828_04920 [Flavobacterium sp. NST-5]|uniref:TonB-dependent receptor plug domain-containing protein n=1 Tax=Flavobacterium ichthyis TaxID=2698827 RepID=A0ABW9Z8M5_9FLAO|nr:hypothetical protein [Flavobacterium ichthyis]NBL64541.1 hypothetical protein [Flavobacterium ichthyis]
MESQDKLYQSFKNAAENTVQKQFPAMEKVWERVEERLDKKVLKQENKTWKKLAIAASVLLFTVLGYQIFNRDETEQVQEEKVVSVEAESVSNEEVVAETEAVIPEENAPIVKDAEVILKKQIEKEAVAVNDDIAVQDSMVSNGMISAKATDKKVVNETAFAQRKFEAVGVQRNEIVVEETAVAAVQETKEPPLVVIDGKVSKEKKYSNGFLPKSDFESVTYLSNPLYIINGEEFTEKELFGPKPTSKYAPLSKQKIVSTTILQGEAAVNAYGEKGKNGVVIITTKK